MMNTDAVRRVPLADIEEFGKKVFRAAGMTEEDSNIVSEHIALASLRGTDSHGLVRYLIYARRVKGGGVVSPTKIEIVKDSGASLLIDGGNGLGQVVGQKTMELLVERAKKSGVAVASIRNSNHLGALAPYTIYAANNGCIGLITTNASPRMAPTNGSQAMLGNNPWSIATPSPEGPVVMDLANSVAALGKVRLIKARGELLPEGWARDNEGVPTRDPQAAITGLLEPIAGYKGYVMALMIELLTGTLSGGVPSTGVGTLTDVSKAGQTSHFFLAISIEHLMPEEEFVASAGKLTSDVRKSRLAKGSTEILIPGDIENRIQKDRRSAGIPLTDELLDSLKTAGSEFNIALPEWMN